MGSGGGGAPSAGVKKEFVPGAVEDEARGGVIDNARLLAGAELRTRWEKRSAERCVDVTTAGSNGDVGGYIREWRRGVIGGASAC